MALFGFHYYSQDRLEQARSHFQKGLVEAQRLELHASLWHSVLGLGLVAAAEGQAARAVTLLNLGLAKGSPYTPFLLGEPKHILAELRRALSSEAFVTVKDQAREIKLAKLKTRL